MTSALTRKVGPLPVWVWLAAAAAGAAWLIIRQRQQAADQGSLGPNIIDPNAVDPASGLTYGQELGAGLTGTGGGDVQSVPTPTVPGDFTQAPSGTPVDLTGGFLDQLKGFAEIATALGFVREDGSTDVAGAHSPSTPQAPAKSRLAKAKERATQGRAKPGSRTYNELRAAGFSPGQISHAVKTKSPLGKPKGSPKATTKKHHRAPAHAHESVHHPAPSHLVEKPAHSRFKVKTPAKRSKRGH